MGRTGEGAAKRFRPFTRSSVRTFVAAAALPLLSACSGVLNSYDVGPDGMLRPDARVRSHLASGHADSALAMVSRPPKKSKLPKDDLLRLLYEGVAAHYAGDYARSAAALDRATLLADDRSTTSLSRAALSVMVNDLSLAYEPSRTELLMLPYYAALSYVRQGNLGGAAVEARRLSAQLQKLADDNRSPEPQLGAFLHYFAGSVFEAAGERASADVAYRNAHALDSLSFPVPLAPAGDSGTVIAFIEQGFVPHRVPETLIVPLGMGERRRLRDHHNDDHERDLITTALTSRILAFADGTGPRTGTPHARTHWVPMPVEDNPTALKAADCDSSCKHDDDDDDDDSYLLRISWPVMYAPPATFGSASLQLDSVTASPLQNARIGDAVLGDFRGEQTAIMTRAVARAIAKYLTTKSAEKSAGKKHKELGDVLGFLANIGGVLTEQADTRSWHLLPGSISVVRVHAPAGAHALHVTQDGTRIEIGIVQVNTNRPVILSHRIWN